MEAVSQFSDEDFEDGSGYKEKKIGAARLVFEVRGGAVELASLRVSRPQRGSGQARAAMNALLAEADRRRLPVKLLASPLDKRTNLRRLVAFYASLGFKVVGIGNPAGDPKMLREPHS